MTDPDGSKALYALAKAKDKTLRLVNRFWHALNKEPGNEAVLSELLAWMDDRVPNQVQQVQVQVQRAPQRARQLQATTRQAAAASARKAARVGGAIAQGAGLAAEAPQQGVAVAVAVACC